MGRLSSNDASCEEGKAAENASMKQGERMMMWKHILDHTGPYGERNKLYQL